MSAMAPVGSPTLPKPMGWPNEPVAVGAASRCPDRHAIDASRIGRLKLY